MLTKKKIAGALFGFAATIGIGFAAETSSAGYGPAKPGYPGVGPAKPIIHACAFRFSKTVGQSSYTCLQNFRVVCKKGLSATSPRLVRLSPTTWRVYYRCYRPPQ